MPWATATIPASSVLSNAGLREPPSIIAVKMMPFWAFKLSLKAKKCR